MLQNLLHYSIKYGLPKPILPFLIRVSLLIQGLEIKNVENGRRYFFATDIESQ
jgi:hypothetical protein